MSDGLELGHLFAEMAADVAGERFKEDAYAAFCKYARRGHFFTTEEVRKAYPHIRPREPRAWGQVALRAKRNGVVVFHKHDFAKNRGVHGTVVTVWRPVMTPGAQMTLPL